MLVPRAARPHSHAIRVLSYNSHQKGPPHEQLSPVGTPRGYRLVYVCACTFLFFSATHVTPAIERPEVLWRALFAPFQVSRSFSCHFKPRVGCLFHRPSYTVTETLLVHQTALPGLGTWANHFLYILCIPLGSHGTRRRWAAAQNDMLEQTDRQHTTTYT